jgi:3-hydroxyisobutyrate dehydrogenase-like beta-hydroxyacid dehydrogenase
MAQKIGFVGLGTMGLPMAINLKKAGFEVIGYDAFQGVYESAAAGGITMVQTLKDVAEQSTEAIVSMVRDYAQNLDVILGDKGLLSAGSSGKTIIVMSTLDPETMNELGARVESESRFHLISAAVSGGHLGAEAGTLSIMTSGANQTVKAFQPYFDAMGSHTFYYGEKPGNSQVAKLVNNMLLAIHMNALAEGLKLSSSYDLPEEAVLSLLKVSTGDSWVARNWEDISQWTAATALEVLLKDVKACFKEGVTRNVTLPFNALSATLLFDSMGKEKPRA